MGLHIPCLPAHYMHGLVAGERSVRDDVFACIESWTIADRAGLRRPLRAAEISYRCGVTGPCVEV